VIVFIPVSKFRVIYETARGRPYSKLEHMVLQAAAEGGVTLRVLSRTFRVHERLLVEAVVTLVTAGWVAVARGPEARFVLTALGNEAVQSGDDPVSVVVSPPRPQIVVMDRVAGQLARNSEVRYYRRSDVDEAWESGVAMRERIERNSLDESQVQKLLPRQTGEWVRRVGPITLASRGTHFSVADVDVDSGLVRGLPPAWQDSLTGRVLALARARAADEESRVAAGAGSGSNRRAPAVRQGRGFVGVPKLPRTAVVRTTDLHLERGDFTIGTDEHNNYLVAVLSRAESSVVVVSPGVSSVDTFTRLAESTQAAVARGVRVDFLIGTEGDVELQDLVAVTNRVGYQADNREGRSRLRVRPRATGSGASLVLYDDENGDLCGLLGDHRWLESPVTGGTALGVELRQASLCGDLARAVGSLWSGTVGTNVEDAASAERWRRLAAVAEDRAARLAVLETATSLVGDTKAELLVDDEIGGAVTESHERWLVGSYITDQSAGDGATRGLMLRLAGSGTRALAEVREENP
jgi:hypothetical protein